MLLFIPTSIDFNISFFYFTFHITTFNIDIPFILEMIKLIISSLVIMILCIVKNICFNLFSVKPNFDIKFYWLPRTAKNLIMWYNKPSSQIPLKNITNMRFYFNLTKDNLIWQQNTLPIGNGYLGANIFGEIITERVSFNEKSLWSGGPCHKRPKYC